MTKLDCNDIMIYYDDIFSLFCYNWQLFILKTLININNNLLLYNNMIIETDKKQICFCTHMYHVFIIKIFIAYVWVLTIIKFIFGVVIDLIFEWSLL